jgi:hypothetical protein
MFFGTLPQTCGSLRGQLEVHPVIESFEAARELAADARVRDPWSTGASTAGFHSRSWLNALMTF